MDINKFLFNNNLDIKAFLSDESLPLKFSEKVKLVFIRMRHREERRREVREGRRRLEIMTENLQTLNKNVDDSTILLEERQTMMKMLVLEIENTISNTSMWTNKLPSNEKLLEDEKKELIKFRNEYVEECETYFEELKNFARTGLQTEITTYSKNGVGWKNVGFLSWNTSTELKEAEIGMLKNKIQGLKRKIEERRLAEEEKNRNLFNEKLKKAMEAEEMRNEKLLAERQAEAKQLTYQIKLKKLQRNQELVKSLETPQPPKPLSMASSNFILPPIRSAIPKSNRPRLHAVGAKRSKPTMQHLFNPKRFLNASISNDLSNPQ